MAKDPAFLFYPGDWLGGTIGMTHEEKGAYIDLLICQFNQGHMTKHMIDRMLGQNAGQLWVTLKDKFQEDEAGLFFNVKLETEQNKRKAYTDSRRNNIKGKNQHTKKRKKVGHMTSHMEDENKDENLNRNTSFEKSEKLFLEGDTHLMGFKGQARVWLENEKDYIWDKEDDFAIDSIERKIKELHRRSDQGQSKEDLVLTFQTIIDKLPEWIRVNKFSLNYIDQKFNEVIHGIKNESTSSAKKGAAPLSRSDAQRLEELLESGALLGVD